MTVKTTKTYDPNHFVVTETGNKISRRAEIHGLQNVMLKQNCIVLPDCILRGDLRRPGGGVAVSISIGSYCLLEDYVCIRPPHRIYKGLFSYYPTKIGDHVVVGAGSIVEAAVIGSYVHIGRGCVIGAFCVIKDCVRIPDGVVVPPNTIIAPFTVYKGVDGISCTHCSRG